MKAPPLTLETQLSELLKDMITHMRARLKDKEEPLTASEMKNMIELLKNNGITCEIKQGEIPAGLLTDLPDFLEEPAAYQN